MFAITLLPVSGYIVTIYLLHYTYARNRET